MYRCDLFNKVRVYKPDEDELMDDEEEEGEGEGIGEEEVELRG